MPSWTNVKIGLALLLLGGSLAAMSLPVQLFPDIRQPTVVVETPWASASPEEIEFELVQLQEEVLRGLEGLREMTSLATRGSATITLRFSATTDVDQALVQVIERLNRLPPLPPEAGAPAIRFSTNMALSLFVQALPGNSSPIESHERFVSDVVRPRLEHVEGVGGVRVWSAAQDQLQVVVDLDAAATHKVNLAGLVQVVRENRDLSAGFVELGEQQFTMRFSGRDAPAEMGRQVVAWRDGQAVRLEDVAEVKLARGDRLYVALQNGNPALLVQVFQRPGANVLQLIDDVLHEVDRLNEGALAARGLRIGKSFDSSIFVRRALKLVGSNLIIGIWLAVLVLALLLRSWRATAVIALVIPVCMLATLLALKLSGRSLNIMSIAGLALAMGLVLDAAIIAVENILQWRQHGAPWMTACRDGTRQVRGALMAATATTVVVFLPVVAMRDVEGQLFADLALTLAFAVMASLAAALWVIPALSGMLMSGATSGAHTASMRGSAKWTAALAARRRWGGMVLIGSALLVVAASLWLPRLDYFPPVKRDAVDVFFSLNPGDSLDHLERELLWPLRDRLEPYLTGRVSPAVSNYYAWVDPQFAGLGVRTRDLNDIDRLERLVREQVVSALPVSDVLVMRASVFSTLGGDDRQVDLHLQAEDAASLQGVAERGRSLVEQAFPGAGVQVMPPLSNHKPSLLLRPADTRAAELGFERRDLADLAQVVGGGLFLGHYLANDRRLPVMVRTRAWSDPLTLGAMPVVTPSGQQATVADVFEMSTPDGPQSLRRVNGRRTVTLRIFPGDHITIDQVIDGLVTELIPTLHGELGGRASAVLGQSADNLRRAMTQLSRLGALALLVLAILVWGLLGSVRDTALVLSSIPMACVGSVVAVRALGWFTTQQLDLLTLFGFVIAMGLVVNNSILLVLRARQNSAAGHDPVRAVRLALVDRFRPIVASSATNIAGMLPLALFPGPGTAIYRGLAVAVIGGLAVSGVYTLVALPHLLRLSNRHMSREVRSTRVQAREAAS